jgi:hypothetical protein
MAEYEPDYVGLGAVLTDQWLYGALYAKAAEIMHRAQSEALRHFRTGDYQDNFKIEEGRHPSRVYVHVVNDNDVALLLEARYHILGRAVG